MSKFEGVADTLYIPLTARIYVSEHFPEYFRDDKAVSLKSEMPYEEIASKSSEYFQMAGACRFYNTDQMVKAFIDRHEKFPALEIHPFEGFGHGEIIAHPELMAEEIKRFINS